MFIRAMIATAFATAVLMLPGAPLHAANATESLAIKVYKTTTCGCCGLYVEYLQQHGAKVTVTTVAEMAPIHARYGVPPAMQSCHTAIVNNYVVEGHVPIGAIRKLVVGGKKIKGIALPGMPASSPGMGVMKPGTLTVYEIPAFGQTAKIFSVE